MSLNSRRFPGRASGAGFEYAPFSALNPPSSAVTAIVNQIISQGVNYSGTMPLLTFTRAFTKAEINNWQGSGGYLVVPAPSDPRIMWQGVRWVWDKNILATYSLALTLNAPFSDGSGAGFNSISSGLTSITRGQVVATTSTSTLNDGRGLGIIVTANGNPTGGNANDAPRVWITVTPLYMAA